MDFQAFDGAEGEAFWASMAPKEDKKEPKKLGRERTNPKTAVEEVTPEAVAAVIRKSNGEAWTVNDILSEVKKRAGMSEAMKQLKKVNEDLHTHAENDMKELVGKYLNRAKDETGERLFLSWVPGIMRNNGQWLWKCVDDMTYQELIKVARIMEKLGMTDLKRARVLVEIAEELKPHGKHATVGQLRRGELMDRAS